MSDDLPPFFAHLGGAFSVLLLQIGRRVGLLDAVLAGGGTAADIAVRAGTDPRNTDEWLRGMTVAGYLTYEDDGGVFAPTELTSMTFSAAFPVSATSVLDGLWAAPQLYDDVVAAVRSGAGIPSDRLAVYAPFAGVNTPTYEQALVGDWMASVPGLTQRLADGARVAEIAPGNGAAAAVLGRAFPASTVVGYDLAPKPGTDLPGNVTIREGDARALPDEGPFDLVYCLDSLHHMGDPGAVLTEVRRVLAPGGVVLLGETDLTGDLDQDAQNPASVIAFTSSVVYCLQEALHGGGEVHSCAEGTRWVEEALDAAGFRDLAVHHSETGYAIHSGVA
jgi:SAM-dependent methyltransferase